MRYNIFIRGSDTDTIPTVAVEEVPEILFRAPNNGSGKILAELSDGSLRETMVFYSNPVEGAVLCTALNRLAPEELDPVRKRWGLPPRKGSLDAI